MKQSFFIPFRLPGRNESDKENRAHWSSGYKQKKEIEASICWIIKKNKLYPMDKIKISYTWIESNKKRDKDNITAAVKFINDALVKMNILNNDGWDHIDSITHRFIVDKDNVGVFVEMEEVV